MLIPFMAIAQQAPAAQIDMSLLREIGVFVGTYGLAVFLVVYYAVKLYPELRSERGEWIREITKLRQLIDPATRSLTRDQAKAVLQLASDALVDRLRLIFQSRTPEFEWSAIAAPGLDREVHYLWGEELSYPRDALDTDDAEREFVGLVKRIKVLLGDRTTRTAEMLEKVSNEAGQMSKRDAYRLALLKYGPVPLESIWNEAFRSASKRWDEQMPEALSPVDRNEVVGVARFLRGHPAARKHESLLEQLVADVRYHSTEEMVDGFKAQFDSYVEEALARIDAQEQRLAPAADA